MYGPSLTYLCRGTALPTRVWPISDIPLHTGGIHIWSNLVFIHYWVLLKKLSILSIATWGENPFFHPLLSQAKFSSGAFGAHGPALPSQSPAGRGVGLGWVKASPGRLPTVRRAFPAGPDWAAVPGCPVTRPAGLLTAPRPRGGARGREMPPCLCVCALVCLGGGGGLWHTCLLHCCSAVAHMAQGSVCLVLQAPAGRLESLTLSPPGEMWAWARNLHVTRTYYPTTPRLPIGTGRRWYVARLGSDPHSLTALGTGGAASRAGSGSHGRGRTLGRWRGTRAQSVLPCPGCRQCWLHWLRRYSPRRRGGPEGTTPEWPLL